MKHVALPLSLFALSFAAYGPVALAHPHADDKSEPASKVERVWPYFGKKSDKKTLDELGADDTIDDGLELDLDTDTMDGDEFATRLEKRFKTHSDRMEHKIERAKLKNKFLKDGADIKTTDDLRSAAKAVEDILSDSGIISGLANMVVDMAEDFDIESSEDGVSLNFEGKRLGRLKVDKDKDESFDIEGFGRNLKIDKKVIRKNGKTKTRIIIEMDGDEEFDIDLTPKR